MEVGFNRQILKKKDYRVVLQKNRTDATNKSESTNQPTFASPNFS